jgi:2-keto-4-pentenoate hydratase/2-oxohepta-3-ene-1,7-dioic acid hydratase in catechol pathway
MDHDRRTFLKTTGLAGAAAVTGAAALPLVTPVAAQAPAGAPEQWDLPKDFFFATLRRNNGYGLGVRTDQGILDVVTADDIFHENAPLTITAVLNGQGDIAGLRRLVERARDSGASNRFFIPEDRARFGPCVTNPEKIVCIGLNYRKHIAEMNAEVPKQPVLFSKFNTALNNHGGSIAVSKEKATNFDYEAELVIVIGRTARNVSEADAPKYIFGYCTGNDFTARDLQSRSSQWLLGKSLDGSGVIGPWLVTADVADGDNLEISLTVNGEKRQSSNTSDMVFNCKQLVSYISDYTTLKPGDLIFTGTPSGVISGFPADKRVWLKAGDKIVTSIEKLGDQHLTLT